MAVDPSARHPYHVDMGAAVDQLIEESSASVGAAVGWLGPDAATPLWELIESRAHVLVAEVRSDDDRLSAEAARAVVSACHGLAEPPPEWWATPLGRLVAFAFGFDENRVTRTQAAAMLGVHPGTVAQMTSRGTALERHPDGGIVRGSVFREIARRSGG